MTSFFVDSVSQESFLSQNSTETPSDNLYFKFDSLEPALSRVATSAVEYISESYILALGLVL